MKVNNVNGNSLTFVDFENGCVLDDGSIMTDWNIVVDDKVCKHGTGWYAITLYGKDDMGFIVAKKAVKLKPVDGTMEEAQHIMKLFCCDIIPFQIHSVDDGYGNELKVYLANGPFLEKQHWLSYSQKVCYLAVTEEGAYVPISMKNVDGTELECLDYNKISRMFMAYAPIGAEDADFNDRSATEATVNYDHINISRETRLYGDKITVTINRGEFASPIILEWEDDGDESQYKPEWLPTLYDLLA